MIKIAINMVDNVNAEVAVVATVYGLNNLPGNSMEEMTI